MLTERQEQLTDQVLRRLVGAPEGVPVQLRDDQRTAVAGLLTPGARALVVQATGWGKSAVYWVTTALRRADGAGPTLVVSPLLSLMRDQVAAAERAGLRAATLNSTNAEDWSAIEADLLADRLDVVLVSPERLANPTFGRRVLDTLAGRLGLLVIDEAHAVSDWGHDFRPDYRRVARAISALQPQTPVLATTATANARVTTDVAAQLGEHTLVLRGPLARRSLSLAVIDGLTALQRYAWVAENLPRLPGSGIVYALTVADAERLAEVLQAQHPDLPVAAYTGKLDGATRERLEDELRANRVKALVATSALGMGYDKPDLGFVVHVGAPPSPVSYYQQVGRAGRAIDEAVVVLLSSTADAGVWDYFATASIPKEAEVERLLAVTPGPQDAPASVPGLEAESGLRRTKVELLLKQLAVEDVIERSPDGWRRTGTPFEFDAAHYDSVLATRRREADIMREYTQPSSARRCLMQLLQESLDDPTATACGRCSVCTSTLPSGLPERPDLAVTTAVAGLLRSRPTVLETRKMWPGGASGRRGRIAPAEQVEPGRVLIHADAPEWEQLLPRLFGPTPDQEALTELGEAAVRLMVGWKNEWVDRPDVVLPLPATGRGALTVGAAEHIARVGRLDLGPAVPLDGSAPSRDLTSPDEASHWLQSLPSWVEQVSSQLSLAGRTVLLVVDETSSGWVVTVAGALLRGAGAARVLPLVLHRAV